APPYLVRHDTLGWFAWNGIVFPHLWAQALPVWSQIQPDPKRWRASLGPLLDAVMGHHGQPIMKGHRHVRVTREGPRSDGLPYVNDHAPAALWSYAEALTTLPSPRLPGKTWKDDLKTRTADASGLVTEPSLLADWRGSNTGYFPMRDDVVPLDVYWEEA